MPNFTREEAIAFNADLNRYMAQEVAADKRAEWVEDRVNQMLKAECSPFSPDHMTEAIDNLEFADQIMLASYMQSAFNLPDNVSAKIYLADFITDRVQDYWHKMSVHLAEKEYDQKGF